MIKANTVESATRFDMSDDSMCCDISSPTRNKFDYAWCDILRSDIAVGNSIDGIRNYIQKEEACPNMLKDIERNNICAHTVNTNLHFKWQSITSPYELSA